MTTGPEEAAGELPAAAVASDPPAAALEALAAVMASGAMLEAVGALARALEAMAAGLDPPRPARPHVYPGTRTFARRCRG